MMPGEFFDKCNLFLVKKVICKPNVQFRPSQKRAIVCVIPDQTNESILATKRKSESPTQRSRQTKRLLDFRLADLSSSPRPNCVANLKKDPSC